MLLSTDDVPELRLEVGAATDTGGRPANEDVVHVAELVGAMNDATGTSQPGFLLAVADGMGGHDRGEVASRLAIQTVAEMVAADPGADVALLLKQAFRRANDAIFAEGGAGGDAQMMGTTLTVAILRGKYATIASIGDSRAYLVRANALTQITRDHSLVADQVLQGSLSVTEARGSPHRNILTHALGHRPKLDGKVPGIYELSLLPEDRLLLCSDGFYDVVADSDLIQVLVDFAPSVAARRLVDLAVERGTTDNVSAVVAQALPTRVSIVALKPEAMETAQSRFGGLAAVATAAAILLFIVLVLVALTQL